ncbi:MAG: ferritin family protein [Tissierellia bacterium]|nr:ferritin family protein [Tissierellia bacterium]
MYNAASIIRYAMEMELLGHKFYEENGKKSENPMTKEIFLKLSKTELEHYEYLKKLLKEYEDNQVVSGKLALPEEEDVIFETRKETEKLDIAIEQSMIPDMNVLRMAYLIEEDFQEYYAKMADKVEDEKLKEILLQFSDWEEGHAKIFRTEYDKRMDIYMNMSWGG